jgi:hypothetical protein
MILVRRKIKTRFYLLCSCATTRFPVPVYSSSFHNISVDFLFQAKLESRVSLLEQEVARRPDIDTVAYRYLYAPLHFVRYLII